MRCALAMLTVLCGCLLDVSRGAEPAPKEAIEKFKALQAEFKARHELYWQLAEHATEEQYKKMYEAMYPSETMVLQFLVLEEENRGIRSDSVACITWFRGVPDETCLEAPPPRESKLRSTGCLSIT